MEQLKRFKHAARRIAAVSTFMFLLAAGAALGQVDDASQEGLQVTLEDNHGDWLARCVVNDGEEACGLSQDVVDPQGNFRVARMQIFTVEAPGEVAAGAVILTPLGTNVSEGIVLRVDSGQPRLYGFKYCLVDGCFARIGFLESELQQMMRGRTLYMSMYNLDDLENWLTYEISLIGFTNGFRAISSR